MGQAPRVASRDSRAGSCKRRETRPPPSRRRPCTRSPCCWRTPGCPSRRSEVQHRRGALAAVVRHVREDVAAGSICLPTRGVSDDQRRRSRRGAHLTDALGGVPEIELLPAPAKNPSKRERSFLEVILLTR